MSWLRYTEVILQSVLVHNFEIFEHARFSVATLFKFLPVFVKTNIRQPIFDVSLKGQEQEQKRLKGSQTLADSGKKVKKFENMNKALLVRRVNTAAIHSLLKYYMFWIARLI